MSEDEYRKLDEPKHGATPHQTIIHGSVGQFAQSHGSNAPITQINQTDSDLPRLFEHILAAIRNHPTATAEQKADLEIDAQHAQLELKRSSPNLEMVKTAVGLMAPFLPLATEIMKHLK